MGSGSVAASAVGLSIAADATTVRVREGAPANGGRGAPGRAGIARRPRVAPDLSLPIATDSAGRTARRIVVPDDGEVNMRRDWIFGFGALSTLAVLVGIDLLLALVEDRGLAASHAILRGLGSPRPRRS